MKGKITVRIMNITIKTLILSFLLTAGSTVFAQWEDAATLPSPRAGMASVIMDSVAYFIGGTVEEEEAWVATDDVLRLDLQTLEWLEPAPALLLARTGASAVVMHDRIYVIGGNDSEIGDQIPQIEVWWPGRNFWQIVDDLDPARTNAVAVANDQSEIIVTGGYAGDEEYLSDVTTIQIDEYYVDSIAFADSIPDLPLPRSGHGAALLDGNLFVFGGYYFGVLKDCHYFDAENNAWVPVDSLSVPVSDVGVSILPTGGNGDHFALVTGGNGYEENNSGSRKLLNDGSWALYKNGEADLPYPRSKHSQVSYDNGLGEVITIVAGGIFETDTGPILIEGIVLDTYFYNTVSSTDEHDTQNILIPSELGIVAFPNPSNGGVSIQVEGSTSHGVIKLMNVLGQQMKNWNLAAGTQRQVFSWDGSLNGTMLPTGMYFLTVENETESEVIKLLRIQ